MDDYCPSCGRCRNCGARQGASPTTIYMAAPNNAAAPAAPLSLKTFTVNAAPPQMNTCAHLKR